MSARIVLSFDDSILAEVELTKPVTVVGRRPDCDIVIEHPAISGRHALLRLEERSVYLEDLASTNGVRVNGLPCSRQVIHHLDLIEIGQHKMHFFDDTLLVSRVSNLERTVHSDFERTLVGGSSAATALTAATTAAAADAAAAGSRAAYDETSRTQLLAALESALDAPNVRVVDSTQFSVLVLRLASGPRADERMSLRNTNTMIGVPGGASALIIRRGRSDFLARLSGSEPPRLNGSALGPGTHPIGDRDLIDVGPMSYEVIQQLESQ